MPASTEHPVPGLPIAVHEVPVARVLRWISMGWRDTKRVPLPSLLHGLIVTIGGWLALGITLHYWYLVPGAFSGFLLVGPILATGLYELSRRLEAGDRPGLREVIGAWRRGTRPLVWLGLILVLAGTAWVLVSAVLFGLFLEAPITGVQGVLRHIVLSEGSFLFPVWILLGGFGASLVFAATVISTPMLLDRDVDMVTALSTSFHAVGRNPITMGVWATFIMIATGIALATAMVGFIVVIPLVGHATWHAYRDVVDTSALPRRQ